jgi:hypothetical protein
MSRDLPVRPNLEFLKKEAKALLGTLRQRNASAQLTDAQHVLAGDYGFASWPKLKAHVESLAAGAGSHPLAGRWIADVARSTRHPANLFRRATVEFRVDENTVNVQQEFVDEANRVVRNHMAIVADGAPHAVSHGYILTARWRGAHALDTVATKNGEVVGAGRYEVSPDGRRLTIIAADQTIVLDRADTGARE